MTAGYESAFGKPIFNWRWLLDTKRGVTPIVVIRLTSTSVTYRASFLFKYPNFAMNLPANYEYEVIGSKKIRTKLYNKEEVEEWVRNLEQVTKVTWHIRKTLIMPPEKARKNIFKRTYHCHFNTRQRKHAIEDRKRKHASRNMDCPALMNIQILQTAPRKRKLKGQPDRVIHKDWPCIVTFLNDHNHATDTADTLSKRPIGDAAKEEILNYFSRGHSVASAYHSFCFQKREELGSKYEQIMTDRHYFPSKIDFSNLMKKYFKDTNALGEKDMLTMLEENLKASDTLYRVQRIGEHFTVSLVTPMMQRAAELLMRSSAILFVDGTSKCEVKHYKLFFFIIQACVGGIPIGCMMIPEKDNLFHVAVKDLIEIMPTKINPNVIITDDDMEERKVLLSYWPNANMLLSTTHVLRSVWKWIYAGNNNINKEDRQTLYTLFKNVLMCDSSEVQVEANIASMLNVACKYPTFQTYVERLLNKRYTWCLFYRKMYITTPSNINNIMEVVFMLFKEVPLEKPRGYNLVQFVDFLINNFTVYYKNRLIDITKNKIDSERFLPEFKDVNVEPVVELANLEYFIGASCLQENYYIDMNICRCSCTQGYIGKICKHQSAVIKKVNVGNACDLISKREKLILYRIATGRDPPQDTPADQKAKADGLASTSYDNSDDDFGINDNFGMDLDRGDSSDDEDVTNATNEWHKFIEDFNDTVLKNLQTDPKRFKYAVKAFMCNYKKHITTPSTLAAALYRAFKPPAPKRLPPLRKGRIPFLSSPPALAPLRS